MSKAILFSPKASVFLLELKDMPEARKKDKSILRNSEKFELASPASNLTFASTPAPDARPPRRPRAAAPGPQAAPAFGRWIFEGAGVL